MQVSSTNPFLQAQANSQQQSAAQSPSATIANTKAATANPKAATVSSQYAAAAKTTTGNQHATATHASGQESAVSISNAAKKLAQTPAVQHASAIYKMDTSAGNKAVNLDQYFATDNQSSQDTYSAPVSLLPSLANVKSLSSHVAAGMSDLLQNNKITAGPSAISFDAEGNLQVPEDYPYKQQLTDALNNDPAMVKELRTLDALANVVGGGNSAAATATAPDASTNGSAAAKILFSASGAVSVTANNQKIS
ncbi:hypothetical protein HR45_05675 [Shewanella mangrovi]|uniref:Uncharacterized protein n=1 Tax=Shewanella mangrovi TaxID=1515746 RepID=A0A094K025_9GAMM|nr:hypothetical protein [Shewanella mangrovi]KFZ38001.1 hypothetical protein HR45_05675 [Shewanella mangrovi]